MNVHEEFMAHLATRAGQAVEARQAKRDEYAQIIRQLRNEVDRAKRREAEDFAVVEAYMLSDEEWELTDAQMAAMERYYRRNNPSMFRDDPLPF